MWGEDKPTEARFPSGCILMGRASTGEVPSTAGLWQQVPEMGELEESPSLLC